MFSLFSPEPTQRPFEILGNSIHLYSMFTDIVLTSGKDFYRKRLRFLSTAVLSWRFFFFLFYSLHYSSTGDLGGFIDAIQLAKDLSTMEWGKRQGLGFFELRRQSTLLYYALFCRHGLCYSDYWLYIRFAGVLRSTFYCKHEKVLPKMVNTAVRLVRIQDRSRSISYLTFLSFAIAWEGNKSNL